ncbi:hypothetical protein GMRT_14422 [Giardia muris]|uniref:Uncharacterized protein n=1 Tax=Giardia muris TaxID=5742 RepID=A0A4Z1SP33_GIAMU|nr:hypothetical protein GMRT_14422 [Giardia muris]|eukprot:TNJ27584.1 hypothetical protein GMRT_14422 [Giardia muris]
MNDEKVIVEKQALMSLIERHREQQAAVEQLVAELTEARGAQAQAVRDLEDVKGALGQLRATLDHTEKRNVAIADMLELRDTQLHVAQQQILSFYTTMQKFNPNLELDMLPSIPALRKSRLAYDMASTAEVERECAALREELIRYATLNSDAPGVSLEGSAGASRLSVRGLSLTQTATQPYGGAPPTPTVPSDFDEILAQKIKELDACKAEIDALRRDNRELVSELRQKNAELVEKDTTLRRSTLLTQDTVPREQYLVERRALENRLTEATNSFQVCQKAREEAEKARDDAAERALTLQDELSSLQAKFDALHEEYDARYATQISEMRSSTANLERTHRGALAQLESDNVELSNLAQALLQQKQELETDIQTLATEIATRDEQIAELVTRLEAVQAPKVVETNMAEQGQQTDILVDSSVILSLEEFSKIKKDLRERGKRKILRKVFDAFNLDASTDASCTMESSLRLVSRDGELAGSMSEPESDRFTISEEQVFDRIALLKADMLGKMNMLKERDSAETEARALKAIIDELETQNRRLQDELKEKLQGLDTKEATLSEALFEVARLRERVGDLEREVGRANDKNAFLTDREQTLRDEYESMVVALRRTIEQQDSDIQRLMHEQVSAYAKRADSDPTATPVSRAPSQAILTEFSDLQRLYEAADRERYELRLVCQKKDQDLEEAEARTGALLQEKARLQQLLDDLTQLSRAPRGVEERSQLATQAALVEDLSGQNTKLELERRSLRAQVDELTEALAASKAAGTTLAASLDEYRRRVDELETDRRSLQAELRDKDARLLTATNGGDERERALVSLQTNVREYEIRLAKAKNEIESLKGVVDAKTRYLEAANNELAVVRKKHEMEVDQLNSRLAEHEAASRLVSKADTVTIANYKERIRDLERQLQAEREIVEEKTRRAHRAAKTKELEALEAKMQVLERVVAERDKLRSENERLKREVATEKASQRQESTERERDRLRRLEDEVHRLRLENDRLIREQNEQMCAGLRQENEETETDRETGVTRERLDYFKAQARKYKDLYKRAYNVVEKLKAREASHREAIRKLEDRLLELGLNRSSFASGVIPSRGSVTDDSRPQSRAQSRRGESGESPVVPVALSYKPGRR